MSEEENIDDYLSSREREHTEDQPSVDSSVAGGVYKAVVEGEETAEGHEPASTVGELQPRHNPSNSQNNRAKGLLLGGFKSL